jgi:hypothetical protein
MLSFDLQQKINIGKGCVINAQMIEGEFLKKLFHGTFYSCSREDGE